MAISRENLVKLREFDLHRIGRGELVSLGPASLNAGEARAWEIHHSEIVLGHDVAVSPAVVGRFAVFPRINNKFAFKLAVHETGRVYTLDPESGLTLRSSASSLRPESLDLPTHNVLAALFKHLGRTLDSEHKRQMKAMIAYSRDRLISRASHERKKEADRKWAEITKRKK